MRKVFVMALSGSLGSGDNGRLETCREFAGYVNEETGSWQRKFEILVAEYWLINHF